MLTFIIIDSLPYIYDEPSGKAYACRFDEKGFTPGAEVKCSAPGVLYNEMSVKAQCKDLDSIKAQAKKKQATGKKVTANK